MTSCLIVDDSQPMRAFARCHLEAMGFATSEAAGGREALEVCRASMPDTILLDWRMPEMASSSCASFRKRRAEICRWSCFALRKA